MHKTLASLTIAVALLVCLPANSFAYLSNVAILEKKDIAKLSDEAITDTYLTVVIEIAAIEQSHIVFIYSPKEYQQYKDFLRYKYELKSELLRRQLEIPSIKDER